MTSEDALLKGLGTNPGMPSFKPGRGRYNRGAAAFLAARNFTGVRPDPDARPGGPSVPVGGFPNAPANLFTDAPETKAERAADPGGPCASAGARASARRFLKARQVR